MRLSHQFDVTPVTPKIRLFVKGKKSLQKICRNSELVIIEIV